MMNDTEFQYIANLSTNTHDFIPDAKNITFFVNEFVDRGLIPTIFKSSQNSKSLNRLQLSSPNNEWVIRFLEDQIDIVKTIQTSNKIGDFETFCDDVIDIWKRINANNERKLNRVGTTYNCFLRIMSEQELNSVFEKVLKPLPNFNNPISWETEIINRQTQRILDRNEELNNIITLKRVQGKMNEANEMISFDRIQLILQINTIFDNKEYRFDNTNIETFFSFLKKINSELITSTIKYLS